MPLRPEADAPYSSVGSVLRRHLPVKAWRAAAFPEEQALPI